MTLQLTSDQLQQIATHAEQTYPEECCGLLIGQIDRTYNSSENNPENNPENNSENNPKNNPENNSEKTLLEVWQVPNAWSSEIATALDTTLNTALDKNLAAAIPIAEHQRLQLAKTDRYWIDPKEMLKAQRYTRDQQLDIIGIYHSHPDHPAVPSECDRRLAWAQYSYLIVSVHHGKAQATRCWSLDEDHQFQPEAIVTLVRGDGVMG